MQHREYRYPCSMPATLRVGSGSHRDRVMIVNVSRHGVRISTRGDDPALAALEPGTPVVLRALDQVLTAEIRWGREGLYGLRLAQPLSSPALARIRQTRGGTARSHMANASLRHSRTAPMQTPGRMG